jgi:hypothetical protein
MALCIQALVWLKALLCKLVSNLRVNFIRVYLNVVNLCNRLAKTLLNFKALLASLITVAQSIKAVLKHVVTISGQNGSLPVTTVPKTRQRAKQASKKGK